MKLIYLLAAVAGAIVPYVFFLQHFGSQGYAPGAFLGAVFATPAAAGFAADLIVSSLVFWLFIVSRRASGPSPWPFVALNLLIGLSCALPAYLYACERAREGVTVSA